MIRLLLTLLVLSVGAYGGYNLMEQNPDVKAFVETYINSTKLVTLEERYSADQILSLHEKDLLQSSGHSFLDATPYYYPYLLLEVKYSKDGNETQEASMLWSMLEGELVIDTRSWAMTHGFEDAIVARASRDDFRVINALAFASRPLDHDALLDELKTDSDTLDSWLASAMKRQLVIRHGGVYRLHIFEPKLNVEPKTTLSQPLVNKPLNGAIRVSPKYSRSQIETISQAAFGQHFAVRSEQEVFVPVYKIRIQNSDGSLRSLFFNAISGAMLTPAIEK